MSKTSNEVKYRYNKKTYKRWYADLRIEEFEELENLRGDMSRAEYLKDMLLCSDTDDNTYKFIKLNHYTQEQDAFVLKDSIIINPALIKSMEILNDDYMTITIMWDYTYIVSRDEFYNKISKSNSKIQFFDLQAYVEPLSGNKEKALVKKCKRVINPNMIVSIEDVKGERYTGYKLLKYNQDCFYISAKELERNFKYQII